MWSAGRSHYQREIFCFFHTAHCCTAVEDWSAFSAGGETGGCPGWWLASLFRPSYPFPVSLQKHWGLGRENEKRDSCYSSWVFELHCAEWRVCAIFDLKVWGVLNKHISNILWHHRAFGSLIMVQWKSETSSVLCIKRWLETTVLWKTKLKYSWVLHHFMIGWCSCRYIPCLQPFNLQWFTSTDWRISAFCRLCGTQVQIKWFNFFGLYNSVLWRD